MLRLFEGAPNLPPQIANVLLQVCLRSNNLPDKHVAMHVLFQADVLVPAYDALLAYSNQNPNVQFHGYLVHALKFLELLIALEIVYWLLPIPIDANTAQIYANVGLYLSEVTPKA